MSPVVRKGLGLLAGVIAASLCVAGVETAGHAILSGDGAFGAAIFALGVGAVVGGVVASRLGQSAALAWAVGALLAMLSLVNVLSFPHPVWFVPAAGLALFLATMLAARLAPRAVA